MRFLIVSILFSISLTAMATEVRETNKQENSAFNVFTNEQVKVCMADLIKNATGNRNYPHQPPYPVFKAVSTYSVGIADGTKLVSYLLEADVLTGEATSVGTFNHRDSRFTVNVDNNDKIVQTFCGDIAQTPTGGIGAVREFSAKELAVANLVSNGFVQICMKSHMFTSIYAYSGLAAEDDSFNEIGVSYTKKAYAFKGVMVKSPLRSAVNQFEMFYNAAGKLNRVECNQNY